jgi:L-rhamnose isomerase
MIDASHNVLILRRFNTPRIAAMLSYAKALLVDQKTNKSGLTMKKTCCRQRDFTKRFRTDVRPISLKRH